MTNDENPPRFEDVNPELAEFIARVYSTGGIFKQNPYARVMFPNLPPVCGLERNSRCPCGSGKKTKKCHPLWVGK